MKNKIMITMALAASISLGACTSLYENPDRESGRHYKEYRNFNHTYDRDDLSRMDVRKMQKSLAGAGYYKGRVDGIWGAQTSQALLEYQNAHQRTQTGTLSPETLREFGIHMNKKHHKPKHWTRERM